MLVTAGLECVLHAHTAEEPCKIVKLFETTNSKGFKEKEPKFASLNMKAKVLLEVAQDIPLEVYQDYPFLGRITLRMEDMTVAIGKVLKLPPKKEE